VRSALHKIYRPLAEIVIAAMLSDTGVFGAPGDSQFGDTGVPVVQSAGFD
jgi:hypothetical protein